MKFRKKPVVIEAIQWDGNNIEEFIEFVKGVTFPEDGVHVGSGFGYTPPLGTLDIPTLEGVMTASPGDWIIRGVANEIYPCKPEIFEQTYEPVGGIVEGKPYFLAEAHYNKLSDPRE